MRGCAIMWVQAKNTSCWVLLGFFLPVVMTPCGVRLCEVCGSLRWLYVDWPPDCLHMVRGFKYFLWKPKKGNFSYFEYWFLGFQNRVFVRGGCFLGGLYACLYNVLFWLLNGVFVGVFWVVPSAFYFVFVDQNFCSGFGRLFSVSPELFYTPYFGVILLCGIWCFVYVLCTFCVRFVYSLSRTRLAPVQRCMYDTCYMSVLSHKTMQKCEKLHNKTLQTTTR